MAKDLFNRYTWLVDTIYRAKRITFEEINERWRRTDMSEGEDLPLRTFHNHRKAIEEMFDINIECSKRGGYHYYIENPDEVEQGGVRSWLLNTFAVNNLLNESRHLKRHILFEENPSGREFLTSIIEAIRDLTTLEITYQGYNRNKPYTFEFCPYCVKVFRQRWYAVGLSLYYNEIRTYALDRIHSLSFGEHHYDIPDDFDPQEYFTNCFGITVDPDTEAQSITIRATGNVGKYLKALPLHHSQKVTDEGDDYTVFSYFVSPTLDFRQELFSRMSDIEVLSPQWLRQQMMLDVKRMQEVYSGMTVGATSRREPYTVDGFDDIII